MEEKKYKIDRTLSIYSKLMNGYIVNKAEEANYFGVNERSIQRDLDDIRAFLEMESGNSGYINTVIYDRSLRGYRLETLYKTKLTNPEILALCKILLDSRAFTKKEMTELLAKLVDCCVPQSNQKIITELLRNEEYHYVQPNHKKVYLNVLWDVGQAIQQNRYVEIKYHRLKGREVVSRKLKPLAIMFSEYYFYLAAFIDEKDDVRNDFDVLEDSFPTIYRIDRIKSLKVLDEHFHIPYANRFEEGEFRKRIQFMYGGKLQKVEFDFCGPSVEAVMDRLPTAQIIRKDGDVYRITAEVFGTGIEMWIRSQGDWIKNVKFR